MFLFRISVRVAVLNFYRLISTKGINQAKLKDGRDLIADHTQASGSSKVYNRTYRYVYYEGYEEVDGYLRAQIDSSSKTVEFDKGQSYYYDYPLQAQDAYQSYKIMG